MKLLDKNVKFVPNQCSKVYTPRQKGGTCWFAVLVMTLFYSQYTRLVSSTHVKRLLKKNDWKTPIAEAMAMILTGYETNNVSRNVVTKLEPHSFLKALIKYDPVYFDSVKNRNDISDGAHYAPYLHKMMAFMEIPHLALTIPRGHITAKYSAFNFDLPIDESSWEKAVESMDPVGSYVDKEYPEVIIIHREAGEYKLQQMWKTFRPKIHDVSGINTVHHAGEITYNKNKYVIDSCIIPAQINTNSCSVGHVIAGVTCANNRFVYNGWTARSADPAMKDKLILRELPCALMPSDWVKDRAMCINTDNCSMNEVKRKGSEFCFESFKRSTVMYVRKDIAEKAGYFKASVPKPIVKNIKPITKNTKPVVKQETAANKLKKLEELKKKIATRK